MPSAGSRLTARSLHRISRGRSTTSSASIPPASTSRPTAARSAISKAARSSPNCSEAADRFRTAGIAPTSPQRLRERSSYCMGTLLDVLEKGGANDPAIVVPDGPRLTYGDLREQVERTADALASLGIERQDRVALVLPN